MFELGAGVVLALSLTFLRLWWIQEQEVAVLISVLFVARIKDASLVHVLLRSLVEVQGLEILEAELINKVLHCPFILFLVALMRLSAHLLIVVRRLRLFEMASQHEQLLEALFGDRLEQLLLVVRRQEFLQLLKQVRVYLALQ